MSTIKSSIERSKYNEFYSRFIYEEGEFPSDDLQDFINYYSILEDKEIEQLSKLLKKVAEEVYRRMEVYDNNLLKSKL